MPTYDDPQETAAAPSVSGAPAPTQPDHSSAPTVLTISDASAPPSDTKENERASELIGAVIDGRYAIERMLGYGGMGQVFLAKDRQLHSRPVVIKLLLEAAYKDPYMLKKFQQEMEALSRIQHPGVIGIIDSGELPNAKPYIVMEYIDGMNLRAQIKPEGMNLERAGAIVKQIGRALAAAHEKGILHRDLKPENIMLQDLGQDEELVKIIDFGIAKIKHSTIAATTATTATAGTIAYMAPEQLSAKPVSSTADIYSLGIIAYEMVTGRRPFNPESPFELLELQRAGVRVPPSDLRPSLSRRAELAIMTALAFDPNQRCQGVREFTDELAQALVGGGEQTLAAGDSRTPWLQATLPAPAPGSPTGPAQERPTFPGNAASTSANVPAQTNQLSAADQFVTAPTPVTAPPPRVHFSLNTSWLKISIGLFSFLIVGSALYGVMLSTRSNNSAVVATNTNGNSAPLTSVTSQATLTYSLTVQKMRDGKPFEEPFRSSGQEIFENGYGFRLNVASARPGYLYVFNEGATATGDMSFTILYPTPKTNSGSAKIAGNPPIETNWNRFAGQAGTEEFWMIWSAAPVPELEAAKESAFASGKGSVTNAALLRSVREFLLKHSEPKPEVVKDRARQETIVRGSGDVVVQLVELEHR